MGNGNVSTELSITLAIPELGEATTFEAIFVVNPNSHNVNVTKNSGGDLTYSVIYATNGYSENAPKDEVNELPDDQLVLENVTSDLNVIARFIPMSFTSINYSVNAGGNITSATSNDEAFATGNLFGNGTRILINAVPEPGKMLDYWTVDGKVYMTANGIKDISETLVIPRLLASDVMDIVVYFRDFEEHKLNYDITHSVTSKNYTPSSYTNQSINTSIIIGDVDILTETSSAAGTTENIVASVAKEDGSYEVTVANIKADIQVSILSAQPILTIDPPNNGNIYVTYVDSFGTRQTLTSGDVIAVGTQLNIQAYANSGFYFGNWTGSISDKTRTQINYITPSNDVVISSVFNVINFGSVTPVFTPVVEIIEDEIPFSDIISVITDGDPIIVIAIITATVDETTGC